MLDGVSINKILVTEFITVKVSQNVKIAYLEISEAASAFKYKHCVLQIINLI